MDKGDILKLKIHKINEELIKSFEHNAILRAKIIETLETKVSARDVRIKELEQEIEDCMKGLPND